MRDYKLYLLEIRENIEDIQEFIAEMDFETFEGDRKTQKAIIRSFEVIGEAANRRLRVFPAPAGLFDIPWVEAH